MRNLMLRAAVILSLSIMALLLPGGYAQAAPGDYLFQWSRLMDAPIGVAVDGADNVFVVDSVKNKVLKFNISGTLLTQWGDAASGSGKGEFSGPHGVAVNSKGEVYVADTGNNRIQKFDGSGNYLTAWGTSGSANGQFSTPNGVAVNSKDEVYVTDSGNNRIQKFDSSGTYIAQWGSMGAGAGQFNLPWGMAFDQAGNVYVAEVFNNRVQKFDAFGGYLLQWGSSGRGNGQFTNPSGVAVDGSGAVYVIDSGSQRVQKFDGFGTYLTQWGGSAGGQNINPIGITLDRHNTVYLADNGNSRIVKYDSSGNYLAQWGNTGNWLFNYPQGVALDGSGNVYVADSNNNRVMKFSGSGALLSQLGSLGSGAGQFSVPTDVRVGRDGYVYVADAGNNRIQKFDSTGAYITQWGSAGSGIGQFSYPDGVALDSGNNVYVVDSSNKRIQKFDSSGGFLKQWSGFGDDGNGYPSCIAVDRVDNVYVGDASSKSIRKFDSSGTLLTQWGSFGSADGQFGSPRGIAVDGSYNLYVMDSDNGVQVFSDTGVFKAHWGGTGNGTGYRQFHDPYGVATDSSGTMIYVADSYNNRIVAFEGFGTAAPSNIAPLAAVTASSQTTATGQTALKAVDGVIDGYPGDYTKEWATNRQGVGAWLNLSWSSPYSVTQVVLYDRPNLDDQITGATLAFSDGSSITVGPLNNNGTATTVSFPARVITGLRMTVTGVSSSTLSAGLSEIQVYGTPGSVTQYTLTTSVSPSGVGSVTANPSQSSYPSGTQVVLTAAPNTGYTFSGWSGGASGTANPLTVTITGNLTVTANFIYTGGSLTITPTYPWTATGPQGGPFTPSSIAFTLKNTGDSALTWNVSKTQQWLTLTLTGSGSLAPGASATVTASINATAATLVAGAYFDTVIFTNVTNGSDTSRSVILSITTPQTSNIAPLATVTASTQNSSTGQTAVKAVDGVIDGYPGDYTKEWASTGQKTGAWLNLSWPASYSVNQVVLYDRPNLSDQITSATLAFSDGSSITVGPLNNNGTATTYSFPARVINGLRMTVTGVSSSTGSVGLSEIQVYGTPASGGTQYTLTTSVSPAGAGTVTANPSQPSYPSGAQVVLTAAPNTGYTFSGWSGGASGTANPLTVTITGNTSITANFVAAQPGTLTITPTYPWTASGPQGGPFTPSSITFTLKNTGGSALTWNASKTQQWLTLSSTGSGSLAPGASATVTATINATAATLAAGAYFDTVTFNNVTDGSSTTRSVILSITTPQTSNIAPLATVTASTQNSSTGQTAVKAVDGVIDGYPGDYTKEWASTGQKVGAWLNLTWSSSHSVTQVVLYDRPNLNDQITGATLTFSDGSSLAVGPLNNNGTATTYSFAAKTITGLRMTVTGVSSSTGAVGLSEIQVYGK